MYIGLHVKCPSFLLDFNETEFLDRFPKNVQIQNFMQFGIRAGGRTDRRTDRLLNLRVVFLSYVNAPSNVNLETKGQEYLLHLSEMPNHL